MNGTILVPRIFKFAFLFDIFCRNLKMKTCLLLMNKGMSSRGCESIIKFLKSKKDKKIHSTKIAQQITSKFPTKSPKKSVCWKLQHLLLQHIGKRGSFFQQSGFQKMFDSHESLQQTKNITYCKVHIFWEGHKILQNLHLTFVCMYCRQK